MLYDYPVCSVSPAKLFNLSFSEFMSFLLFLGFLSPMLTSDLSGFFISETQSNNAMWVINDEFNFNGPTQHNVHSHSKYPMEIILVYSALITVTRSKKYEILNNR